MAKEIKTKIKAKTVKKSPLHLMVNTLERIADVLEKFEMVAEYQVLISREMLKMMQEDTEEDATKRDG